MAEGSRHYSYHHLGLFLLSLLCSLFAWGEVPEGRQPATVIANKVNSASDAPSFYGHRTIKQQPLKEVPAPIEFQRRAIAPPIIEEAEMLKIEEANLNHATLSVSPDDVPLKQDTLPRITLSRDEQLLAKKAQYYIDRNWQDKTGFIDSVQGYPHSTMWDVASGLSALLALEGLGLYSTEQTDSKIARTLKTLFTFPLYDQRLPNREYNTHTGLPSGRLSDKARNGNGWSALDIGRLLIWLEITSRHKPHFKPDIDRILSHWQLADAIHQQTLYGELYTGKKRYYRQEGRLGYLQYTAQGFEMAGFGVDNAYSQADTRSAKLDGHTVFIDERNLPYFTSDPYVLNAVELGRKGDWWDQLDTLFALHKAHSAQQQSLWVFAEDALNHVPWFAYNNIFIYGRAWLSTAPGGKPIENPQIFSNKMALGFSVLYPDDPFGQQLHQQVIANSLHYRAVPTGVLRNDAPNLAFNINTNAFVLSALWYKHRNYLPLFFTKPLSIMPSQALAQ
ncbi:DUF3131 domain-containing protein [Photobacterium aphoticum]|uniref:DUF3131 domain-containing protein n=2 Tax=Photobacterium aphoticum TaxID=754436 RepID=A0A0J1GUL1_9GAMM|nr:DUF3131 domain-containing protein [Photobacterium aphoticum]KLV03119.1 hypothetical protein ABT58_00950 [Photobacterium aphoticum]PSU56528.1 DUF3131 domain-containing protein [Photobacterium aphoticum]GHA51997.1 hypothetical protein GCM10007086_27440 [Photobacterium aphoticum]